MMRYSKRSCEGNRFAGLLGYAVTAVFAASVTATDVKHEPTPPPLIPDIKTVAPKPFKTPFNNWPIVARPRSFNSQPVADKPADASGAAGPQLVLTKPLFDVVDDSHWVRGQSYKAQFNTGGVTFIPFVGASAPQSYPVHFSLESISVGGEVMLLDRTEPQRVDQSIIFNRGPVQEIYHIALDSIEQTFVLHERPAESGNLSVRIAVSTDLAKTSADDSLQFSNESGTVKYSHAVLVDAAGDRSHLHTALNGGYIELTMPESLLASAAYPITIDPVISAQFVYEFPQNNRWPDVAYDATTDLYLVVWENQFNANDGDIFSLRVDSTGLPVQGESVVAIDFTSDNWRRPRVANNNLVDNYLVVAERGFAPTRVIWGRIRSSTSATMGAQFQIGDAPTPQNDQYAPDVGGDPATVGPTYYMVVWTRAYTADDHDIHGKMVNSNGTVFGGLMLIDNSLEYDVTPSISNTNGLPPFATQNWTIVWAREFNPFDYDICGAQIRWDGFVTTPSSWIDIYNHDSRNPSVSTLFEEDIIGGERRYAVVYDVDDVFSDEGDIYAKVLRGLSLVAEGNLTTMEGVVTSASRRNPVVESTANGRFVVATSQQLSGNDWDAYISHYCVNGTQLNVAEQHRLLAYTGAFEGQLRLAGVNSGGGDSINWRKFVTVWMLAPSSDGLGEIIDASYWVKEISCCIEDINDDGQIGVPDLLTVINHWGCQNCSGDVDGNLSVGVPDLLMIINAWGPCP